MVRRQTATDRRGADIQTHTLPAAFPGVWTWSYSASCDGIDTRAFVGNRLGALVGRVRERSLTDERPHISDVLWGNLGGIDSADDPVTSLLSLVRSVHDRAHPTSADTRGAATLTAVVRDDVGISVVHVGDARVVRIRHGAVAELTPLNCPHTLAAEMQAAGRNPNSRASTVITRVVGSDDELTVDLTRVPLEPGLTSFLIMGAPEGDLRSLVRRTGMTADASATLAVVRQWLPHDSAAVVLMLSGNFTPDVGAAMVGSMGWRRDE